MVKRMRTYHKAPEGVWTSVSMPVALHRKAERLAAKDEVALSALLAQGLAMAIADPGEIKRTSRTGSQVKASAFLRTDLHEKAKRALVRGGSMQGLFMRGLELLLNEAKAA